MGLIDEAFKRSPRNNSFGDAAAAMSNPGVTQVQTAVPPAPKPISPTNTFPQGHPSAGRSPYVSAPASPPGGLSYMDNNESVGRGIKDSWNKGNYGEAVGKTVAGTVGMFTNPLIDGAAGAFEGAKGVGRGLFGIESPAQAPAPASTTAPGAQAGAGAGRGVVNPSMAEPSKPLPQPGPANAPSGAEVMPGVYQHGRGQYSDSAAGMGMPAGFTGKPSAQNLAAADNLDRPRGLVAYAALNPPDNLPKNTVPLIQAATVAHSGNSWSAQNALRNAQVSASSIMNNGGRWDQHKGVSPERAYAAAMENADFAARGAQPGMDQAAMRENAAIQREGMQQAGSTARAQMMEVGQNNRFGQTQGLARDKLSMEQETQGFSNRAAAQSEQLRNQIMQEKDPAKRQAIVQRLREMQGQTQPSEWGVQVTPTTKNVDGSTSIGSIVRYNKATGQTEVVQQPGQGGKADPGKYQQGVVYKDANGQRRQWDGTKFVPV